MAASKEILDFFNEQTFTSLIGRESNLTIDFDPEISKNDGMKFNNKEVDSLDVKTLGEGTYNEDILQLIKYFNLKIFA